MTLAHGPIPGEQTRSTLRSLQAPLSLLAAIGLVAAAMLLPVMQSSGATTTGYLIQRHQQELAELQANSYDLQAQIAQLGSTARIHSEATRLGFVVAPRPSAIVNVAVLAPAAAVLPRSYLPPFGSRSAEPSVQVVQAPQHNRLWSLLHIIPAR